MDDQPLEGTPEKDAVEIDEAEDYQPDSRRWPPWAGPLLSILSEGHVNISKAAERLEIHRRTVYKLRDRDEAFRIALYDAREEGLDLIEATLYAASTRGLPSPKVVTEKDKDGNVVKETQTVDTLLYLQAGMFLLKRWRPEYRESFRVEQTGAGGGPIQHEVALVDELAGSARSELDRLQIDLTTDLIPISGDVDS